MKKVFLASLMTICIAASASALEIKPYVGFFPISYEFSTRERDGSDDQDYTILNLGMLPNILVGVKVSDFRVDFTANWALVLDTPTPSLNVYYDFEVNENLLPYVKLGGGYLSQTKELDGGDKNTRTTTTYAVGAGIGYKVVNNFIFDLGVDYNIMKEKNEHKDKFSGSTSTSKTTYSGFGVRLGGRVQF